MRMILIAVVALLVLGGGGAGAYFYFMTPAEASAGPEAEAAKAAAEQHAKEEPKLDAHGQPIHSEFVELDALILPIIDEDGLTQVISLVVALEVEGADAAGKVESMSPKLKDAFIQDMYGMLSHKGSMKGGIIQVGPLKTRLNAISKKVMGDDVVKDVLLQVVQQRPA